MDEVGNSVNMTFSNTTRAITSKMYKMCHLLRQDSTGRVVSDFSIGTGDESSFSSRYSHRGRMPNYDANSNLFVVVCDVKGTTYLPGQMDRREIGTADHRQKYIDLT